MKNFIIFACLIFLIGCTENDGTQTADNIAIDSILKVGDTFYWQLDGMLISNINQRVVDIDLYDTDESQIAFLKNQGKIVICYFSAGTLENWRTNKGNYPLEGIGNEMDGWEGENWIDYRIPEVWEIQEKSIYFAREKGCDGVEPDNVDGYLHDTGFKFSVEEQIAFNKKLAAVAHQIGLLIGLKNSPELVGDLVDFFDFALAEECWEFSECEEYQDFIFQGKPVFDVEYNQDLLGNFKTWEHICFELNEMDIYVVGMPLGLDGSWIQTCK